jgi:hypothetical protein
MSNNRIPNMDKGMRNSNNSDMICSADCLPGPGHAKCVMDCMIPPMPKHTLLTDAAMGPHKCYQLSTADGVKYCAGDEGIGMVYPEPTFPSTGMIPKRDILSQREILATTLTGQREAGKGQGSV